MRPAAAKIRPPRPRTGPMLDRPALAGRVAQALARERAVLLCAPAGYGKTAALVQALDHLPDGHALAWVALDEGDDLRRLLDALMAALEPHDVPWRTAPEGLVGAALRPAPEALPEMVAEFVDALEACTVPHGVIALDDLHHLEDEPALRFVDLLLAQLSPRWTVAMSARHEPALRLSRLRALGELAEFREAALRFAPEESRALLQRAGFDAATADRVHQRSAGWPAGLRLALGGGSGGSAAIDRAAFDFLAAEVLARLEPGLRDFLVETSMLLVLDPATCTAVTGDADAAARLAEIERLALFATVVDESLPAIRLHDLFRDALRHRLRSGPPQRRRELLRRAAAVERDPVRVQSLLLAAGDPEAAAQALFREAVNITTMQGGVNVLLQLCDRFPPDFAETSAELHRVRGLANWSVWETSAAEHHLQRSERLFAERGEQRFARLLRAHRAITLIGLGRLGEVSALVDDAEVAGDDALDHELRCTTALVRTWHTLESCRFDDVAPAFAKLVQVLEQRMELRYWFANIPPPRQTSCAGIGPMLQRWAEGVLAVVREQPVPLRASAYLTLGWRRVWQGLLDEAEDWLAKAVADAQWTGQQVISHHHALALRAVLAALRGRRAEAMETMRVRIAALPRGYGDWGRWHGLLLGCRIACACGDAAALRAWRDEAVALHGGLPDTTPDRLHPLAGVDATLAWMEGRTQEAIALWTAALERPGALDLIGQTADVRVRLAAALAGSGERERAAVVLTPLVAAPGAQPGGALFAAAALRELAAVPWGTLLDAAARARLQRWAAVGSTAPAAPSASDELLSPREWDVLGHIAAGASNKLIARALDLSPHTVKRHVANILDKLDLAGRAQASAWWHANRPS